MREHQVTLIVAGQRFTGWQSVSVTRSMEQLSGSFDLTLTDKWALDGGQLQLLDGQACQVLIDSTPVITGYIDEAAPTYDKDTHQVTLSGRDRTGDLVDCAALHKSQEINGRTLLQVVQSLCEPFGITVSADVDTGGVLPTAHVQPGETVYELLDRLARSRGVLYTTDGHGALVLTRTGNQRASTALVLGHNILSGSSRRTRRDRYSQYHVLGQHRPASGTGGPAYSASDSAAAQASAVVTDPGIARYRPTVIDAEDQAAAIDCRTRGEWERSVRAGRSATARITVRGWTDAGQLWAPNRIVRVEDHWLGLRGDYLISAVRYAVDESGGQVCELTVTSPDAFKLLTASAADPTTGAGLFAPGRAP
ncbi:MAG: contractile injection system protein, VgrG/Pvc8 family [Salinisphaera sp.]|jgi:prophage tail gpP-like protein|nr:contractile injection system protein, VgrG/Pvc8 family [Salinisphaera sp.]